MPYYTAVSIALAPPPGATATTCLLLPLPLTARSLSWPSHGPTLLPMHTSPCCPCTAPLPPTPPSLAPLVPLLHILIDELHHGVAGLVWVHKPHPDAAVLLHTGQDLLTLEDQGQRDKGRVVGQGSEYRVRDQGTRSKVRGQGPRSGDMARVRVRLLLSIQHGGGGGHQTGRSVW